MHTFASPQRGHCASCDGVIADRPVYLMDEAYCCLGCAQGGPCVCTYEQDLADDGVTGLGLPFRVDEAGAGAAPAEPARREAAVR